MLEHEGEARVSGVPAYRIARMPDGTACMTLPAGDGWTGGPLSVGIGGARLEDAGTGPDGIRKYDVLFPAGMMLPVEYVDLSGTVARRGINSSVLAVGFDPEAGAMAADMLRSSLVPAPAAAPAAPAPDASRSAEPAPQAGAPARKWSFVRMLPSALIGDAEGGKRALIPMYGGASAEIIVPEDDVFPSKDGQGRTVPGKSNVRFPAGAEVEALYGHPDGRNEERTMPADDICAGWAKREAERIRSKAAAAREPAPSGTGREIVLKGVDGRYVSDSGLPDPDVPGATLLRVTLPDRDGAKRPGSDPENPFGHGMLLASCTAVAPSRHGGWKNVSLGNSGSVPDRYSVCSGFGEDGKALYRQVRKTAGAIAAEYADWEEYTGMEREGPEGPER